MAEVSEKILPTLLVVAIVLFTAYFMFAKRGDISSAEARGLVQAGARLVDVRTPGEFAAGHIPGAVNIPVGELNARMSELDPRDVAVVVYCRSGQRSSSAARLFRSAGFKAVRDLGPMSRW